MSSVEETQNGQSDAATAVMKETGELVSVSEAACEIYGYDKSDLLEMQARKVMANPCPEKGMEFQKFLYGDLSEIDVEILQEDGTILDVRFHLEKVTKDDEVYAKAELEVLEEVQSAEKETTESERTLEEFSDSRIQEIAANIRVDTVDGEMPLNELVFDIVRSHNEVEQAKIGALTLQKRLDERLEEEEKRNPDSAECEVLKEARELAHSLHQRLQG